MMIMLMFSLPVVPENNGTCSAFSRFASRLHVGGVSFLRSRTWLPVQISSRQGMSLRDEGSHAGVESRANLSKKFVSQTQIENAASRQGLSLSLETVGPFFRVKVSDIHSKEVLGAAQGLVKIWTCGRILHLDSVRLSPSSSKAKRPIFGIAFLLGAAAVRHGYDLGCVKAELLAIKDTDTYHSKLVRYYSRMGFKSVYEVTGESLEDIPHMLIWGGVGTRMDANIEELLLKWSPALMKASEVSSAVI